MKPIESRGQLIDVINRFGVETYPVEINEDKKVLHTVVHKKRTRQFYRITWGEVRDNEGIFHLWYNENYERVELDPASKKWVNNQEKKEIIEARTRKMFGIEVERFDFSSTNKELIFINGLISDLEKKERVNEVQVLGGLEGSGKTEYVIKETARALKRKESVLFFSIDEEPSEVMRRLIRTLALDSYSKLEKKKPILEEDQQKLNEAMDLISNSKLIIDNHYLVDDNYILNKMREVSESENGLDFVVIDYLKLDVTGNFDQLIKIHEKMEMYRQKLGCKVIMTTRMKNN